MKDWVRCEIRVGMIRNFLIKVWFCLGDAKKYVEKFLIEFGLRIDIMAVCRKLPH